MARRSLAAGVCLAGLTMVGAASAQDVLRDLRSQNEAALAADIARQDLLATQREITARQDRARTDMVLRELDAGRAGAPDMSGLAMPPPTPFIPPDDGQTSLSMQMDRMERLTQDAMARSNVRIRAVRPASER